MPGGTVPRMTRRKISKELWVALDSLMPKFVASENVADAGRLMTERH